MGFSRQEYWSGLPFPLPGDLPNLPLLHLLHWQADFLPLVPPGKPKKFLNLLQSWLLSAKGSSVGKGTVCAVSNPPSPHPLLDSWGVELSAGKGSMRGTDHTNHALHCHLFSSRMNLYSSRFSSPWFKKHPLSGPTVHLATGRTACPGLWYLLFYSHPL